MYLRTSWISMILVTAGGCAAEQDVRNPGPLPAAFVHTDAQIAAAWPGVDWYREFGSSQLDALVSAASSSNFDLEVARARMLQADARARQAGAALLPTVDATPNGTFYAGHSAQGAGHEFDWTAMLSASYELDFWGKNRAAARSALALTDASRAERDTVALTTLAQVATGYFQTLALRERLQIARSNRDAAKQLLAVIQARFDAGLASPGDVAIQETVYDASLIAISDLVQTETEAVSALSMLLGRLPEEVESRIEQLGDLKEPAVRPGMPSELLARRPDISLAEANLRAARADVAAARAAMFPSLSLTANAGVANPVLPATVLTIPGIGPSLALGASLTQPIFDHGKLKAQRDEARARETELLATYRASIIAAFADAEIALGALGQLNVSYDAQRENLTESERAFAGAQARYEAGSGDFLTVLDAQRTFFLARDQAVRYRLARLQALVALNKALGGGWNATALRAVPTAMGERQ